MNARVYHGGSAGRSTYSRNGSSGKDEKVKNSSGDSTADYLQNKLVAGNNVTISEVDVSGSKKSKIDVASSSDEKVKNSAGDPIADYLMNKLVAGQNVTISEVDFAGSKKSVFEVANSPDEKVKASIADNRPNYLFDKMVAGNNCALSIIMPGIDERIKIDVTNTDSYKVNVTGRDTRPSFLFDKIQAGNNVSIAVIGAGASEVLRINAADDPGKVYVSSNDFTKEFLFDKLQAGSNIQITKSGSNPEKVTIAAVAQSGVNRVTYTFGTGSSLSVGAFIPPVTEGSAWANSNLGLLMPAAGFVKSLSVMLPRFVSYNATDYVTIQLRKIAASAARGASPLTAGSGVAIGSLQLTCPVTGGAFWYNNYNFAVNQTTWTVSSGDLLFCVVSAQTVNAVTGCSATVTIEG